MKHTGALARWLLFTIVVHFWLGTNDRSLLAAAVLMVVLWAVWEGVERWKLVRR